MHQSFKCIRQKKGKNDGSELMAASMNSLLYFTTATIITIMIFLLPSTSCFTQPPSTNSEDPSTKQQQQQQYQQQQQVLLSEEKTRLGSRPPSCHNKCNACHPCMAVQVPTVPKHVGNDQSRGDPAATHDSLDLESSSSSGCNNRYSNYKPLGWKCRCRNHFYNP